MIALNKPYRRMGASPTDSFYHQPVLLAEVMACLRPAPGKLFFDGTFGGGGHATALLEFGATVIAGDQDPAALANATRLQHRFGSRLTCWEINFADVAARFEATATPKLDGVLLDLGVSSHQLETPDRGFSFQRPGPLDMRMGPNVGPSAAELLNTASEAELTRILRQYGEEPAARRIAAQIVRTRETQPFVSTIDLSETVERVVHRRGPRHPATRVFQALRIAVNRELTALEEALPVLAGWLKPGGRLVVIAFHSLEDRIVKLFCRDVTREWLDRPEWPEPRKNPAYGFRLLTPRPIEPSEREQRENPRARSAKLRAIEKL